MATARIKALAAVLRSQTKPLLIAEGFKYDSSTRTFRKTLGDIVQIINFQAGVRAVEGKFTVNLGIFHPTYSQAALCGYIPEKPKEYDCVIRRRLASIPRAASDHPMIARLPDGALREWLLTPMDKWWKFSSDEQQVAHELRKVETLLLKRGLPWLNENSSVAAVKKEYEKFRPMSAGA